MEKLGYEGVLRVKKEKKRLHAFSHLGVILVAHS